MKLETALFDFGALFSSKAILLRGDGRSAGEEQGEQADDLRSEAVRLGKPRTGLHGITSSASLSQIREARNSAKEGPDLY